nr:MAG TPA: hypothetical protein [Microviridae sp.]
MLRSLLVRVGFSCFFPKVSYTASLVNHTKSLVQCERKTELSSQFLFFLVYKR